MMPPRWWASMPEGEPSLHSQVGQKWVLSKLSGTGTSTSTYNYPGPSQNHSNLMINTDGVSRSLGTNGNHRWTDHQRLQSSNSESNPLQTMPCSGSFIRDQSTSTDNSKVLHQQFLDQQLLLDQTLPLEVDEQVPSPGQKSKIGSIYPPELIYPKSRYHGYIPPIPASKEHQARAALLQEIENKDVMGVPSMQEDFVEFELTEFSVYMLGGNCVAFKILQVSPSTHASYLTGFSVWEAYVITFKAFRLKFAL